MPKMVEKNLKKLLQTARLLGCEIEEYEFSDRHVITIMPLHIYIIPSVLITMAVKAMDDSEIPTKYGHCVGLTKDNGVIRPELTLYWEK